MIINDQTCITCITIIVAISIDESCKIFLVNDAGPKRIIATWRHRFGWPGSASFCASKIGWSPDFFFPKTCDSYI